MKKKISTNIMLYLRLNAINYVLTVNNFLIALVLLVSELKERKNEVLSHGIHGWLSPVFLVHNLPFTSTEEILASVMGKV